MFLIQMRSSDLLHEFGYYLSSQMSQVRNFLRIQVLMCRVANG